ncbi:ATP-dependent permease MDL1, mitochondrial [Lecanosticta acicola]|uniref:ATP-dependent permease MDL1, mitochondrial n=1 Tax=Lecanosticta acicola TaxID=111012 RepID=A0AAI9ECI7_9PEZI|nr:ATP-dependent permease MDL1, mitochondrial [Lecanosticta acicola]
MAMRGPNIFAHRAWDSLGNGALFTQRIRRCAVQNWGTRMPASTIGLRERQAASLTLQLRCCYTGGTSIRPTTALLRQSFVGNIAQRRVLQTSQNLHRQVTAQTAQALGNKETSYRAQIKRSTDPADVEEEDESQTFKKSDKAAKASQVNLSARLSNAGQEGEGASAGGWKEIARLLGIARPEAWTLGAAIVLLLISSSVTMTLPFSIGKIIDAASSEEGLLLGLKPETFFIGLASLLTAGACANYGRIVLLRIVGERIVTKLRSSLFRRTFQQNAEFFDANRVGDLISRLGSDTIIVGKSITQNVSDGLRSLISAAAGLSLMAYVSVKLTGLLAIAIPPVAMTAFFYGRAIRSLSRKIQKNLGTLTRIAEERLGNVRTSQAFAGELQEVHRYNGQVRKLFALGKKEAFISAAFFSSSGFMGNMTFLMLLYVGGNMVRDGTITVGDLSTFLMYTGYAGSSLFGLSSFFSELMKGAGAASRLFELQDRSPTISPTKGDMVKSARGMIELKDVSFAYPTRPAVQIFNDLSFKIPQGSNVAIVAPSGAGKSTVASLLMRFYTPDKGVITIAGKDINTMNAKQLRRKIGFVGQEPVLFSGSIAENIAYGRPLASRAEIVTAARQANCQFIGDFPDGLETFVGARGTQLSGGQKQRLAIARALLKNPDILILDEATSALDAESETLVNQALQALLRSDNTTISIAHRLSTIQRSDTIICLNSEGRVAQTGTYAELSADKEGAFSKLMEWQMSGGQTPVSRRDQTAEDDSLTEEERMRIRMEEHDKNDGDAASAPSEEETQWEAVKVKDGNQSAAESVMEKTGMRDGGVSNRKGYRGS